VSDQAIFESAMETSVYRSDTHIRRVHKKPSVFFGHNLDVHKFPSNMACNYSSQCRTVCVKTIHFTWRAYTYYLV